MQDDSLSFNGLVVLYEETRTFDAECFSSALDYLQLEYPPERYRNVFEPGIGNGRIAIPLARRGYDVTGVDISSEMLLQLSDRLHGTPYEGKVSFQQADVTDLPFADDQFDMAIVVHLFYFISDWKKSIDEICRVVKSDGSLILMHTGTGEEIPELNQRYKELCADLGVDTSQPGAKSTSDVIQYLQENGKFIEYVKDRWVWTSRIPIANALDHLQMRAYSFTTSASDHIHNHVMCKLRDELKCQDTGTGEILEITNQIYLAIIRNAK